MKTPRTIRLEIMLQLYGQQPGSRSAENIVTLAKRDNVKDMFELSEFEVTREAKVLEGLGHVRQLEGMDRWAITAQGVLWMEKEGLV